MEEITGAVIEKKKAGRPRKLYPAESNVSSTIEIPIEQSGIKIDEKPEIKNDRFSNFLPFTGKENLPEPVYDKEGKCIKEGDPRYFANGNNDKGFKIIKVWKTGRGVERSLWRHLKPKKKNHIIDRELVAELKKAGIAGL